MGCGCYKSTDGAAHLPVDDVGVVEDVARFVEIVELLGREHNGDRGVVQLARNLDEKLFVAHHVRIEDDHHLHQWSCE